MKIQWKINENFNEISINKELCKSHDKRAISKFQIQQISFKFIQLPFKHFSFGESERFNSPMRNDRDSVYRGV